VGRALTREDNNQGKPFNVKGLKKDQTNAKFEECNSKKIKEKDGNPQVVKGAIFNSLIAKINGIVAINQRNLKASSDQGNMKWLQVLIIGKYSLGFILAFLIGASSTLFGIGGGPLLVPLLVYFFGLSDNLARGTSLALVIITGALGLFSRHLAQMDASQYFDTRFFLLISIPIAIGSLFTIQILSHLLGTNIDLDPGIQGILRKYFGVLLIFF